MAKNNQGLRYTAPPEAESGGYDIKTFYYPAATSVSDLKTNAETLLEELKTDSMQGSITTFGIPFARQGDIILISDTENKERNGKQFRIDTITYTFSQSGYRQIIYPGKEIK